jgi:hypothetical protein
MMHHAQGRREHAKLNPQSHTQQEKTTVSPNVRYRQRTPLLQIRSLRNKSEGPKSQNPRAQEEMPLHRLREIEHKHPPRVVPSLLYKHILVFVGVCVLLVCLIFHKFNSQLPDSRIKPKSSSKGHLKPTSQTNARTQRGTTHVPGSVLFNDSSDKAWLPKLRSSPIISGEISSFAFSKACSS